MGTTRRISWDVCSGSVEIGWRTWTELATKPCNALKLKAVLGILLGS